LNVVTGLGGVVGAELVRNSDVAKISFTGSVGVGEGIMRDGAATMKRVTLELGAKAAIILWNTVYLERAIGALRQQGRQIDEGLLKHVAPVHWNHINLTGDYSWRQNKRVEKGGFRPLRIRSQS